MANTEQRNPNTMHIDRASTREMLEMIQKENIRAAEAVGEAIPAIEKAVDAISERMKRGGRLLYIGAGTSGRLGVLDASECPPTFGVSYDLVVGIIAGGNECITRAGEAAEDSGENGVRDLENEKICELDSIVGISASGNAAYVAEALVYARKVGALTVGVTSNGDSRLALESDIAIVTETGPEPISGSTRMKAGSAQKMVLNMLSTCAMVKLGNVYENLMINLSPSNEKLRRRVISIVREICSCDEQHAFSLLEAHNWVIREVVEAEEK